MAGVEQLERQIGCDWTNRSSAAVKTAPGRDPAGDLLSGLPQAHGAFSTVERVPRRASHPEEHRMTAPLTRSRSITDSRVRPTTSATQLAMALLTTALVACGGMLMPSSASAASIGSLDTSFGKDGVVKLPRGTQLNGSAVQRDGKLVVTGLSGGEDHPRLLVARLTRSGKLDRRFGRKGIVRVRSPRQAKGALGEDVEIQRNGRIVVAGDVRGSSGADGMIVVRLKSNGSLDRRFGRRGVAAVLRGARRQAEGNALAIRSNGRIVVGGAASQTAALVQLNSRGRLLRKGVRLIHNGQATIDAITLLPKGKIGFAGTRRKDQITVAIIGRARSSGARDRTFGARGIRERSYARGGAAASGFRDVAALSNGRLVATGYAFDGSGGSTPGAFAITARFSKTGRPVSSFGAGGVRYTPAARTSDVNTQPPPGFSGIAIDRGHIYAGGSWDEFGSSALNVQSLTTGGSADSSFGTAGQTIAPIDSYSAPGYGNDVALSPQGLYVVGVAGRQGSDAAMGLIARIGAHPARPKRRR